MLSGPAITSAQVAVATTARPWMTFILWVLSPHRIFTSPVRPSRVDEAENVSVDSPALPEVEEIISHGILLATVQLSLAVTVMDAEPPATGIDT